jgi:phage shock protein A
VTVAFLIFVNAIQTTGVIELFSFLCSSKQKGELPAGRTVAPSSNKAYPFKDSEIEMELNELRRKAADF